MAVLVEGKVSHLLEARNTVADGRAPFPVLDPLIHPSTLPRQDGFPTKVAIMLLPARHHLASMMAHPIAEIPFEDIDTEVEFLVSVGGFRLWISSWHSVLILGNKSYRFL